MAPARRRSAPSSFNQDWHETGTDFLNPDDLPVGKVPRAWERKQETKISHDGKQKKVWRRYTLRSQSTTDANNDSAEDNPAQRAVKKLRVRSDAASPKISMSKSKQRAFRATRWDRRKSALPRKRTDCHSDRAYDEEEKEEEQDATTNADLEDARLKDVHEAETTKQPNATSEVPALAHGTGEHSMFTFRTGNDRDDNDPDTKKHRAKRPIHVPTSPRKRLRSRVSIALGEETLATLFPTPVKKSLSIPREIVPTETEGSVGVVEGDINSTPQTASNNALHDDEGDFDIGPLHDVNLEGSTMAVTDEPLPLNSTNAATSNKAVELSIDEDMDEVDAPQCESHAEKNPIADTPTTSTTGIEEEIPKGGSSRTDSLPEVMDEVPASELIVESGIRLVAGGAEDMVDAEKTNECLEELTLTEASLELEQQDVEMTPPPTDVDPAGRLELAWTRELREPPAATKEDSVMDMEEIPSADNTTEGMLDPTMEDCANEVSLEGTDVFTDPVANDIAEGLTLGSLSSNRSSPRKLRSPSPPPVDAGPDDVTVTMHLDDDTALLKDFLTRAAASKANKIATIARRTSLQNRRESDAVRQALASPRKVLEDKDPNSPSKYDKETTLDLSQTLILTTEQQPALTETVGDVHATAIEGAKGTKSSRRSTRAKKTRLPALSSAEQQVPAPRIAVRRADGGDPIVLKRTEAQELGLMTRSNTRKNKQGAVAVHLRLLKLSVDGPAFVVEEAASGATKADVGKTVRWDEQLAYFQESQDTQANALANAESMATPDELSMPTLTSSANSESLNETSKAASKGSSKPSKVTKDKNSTPRVRRMRGLGAANGTPGKGLLAPASLLPDEVQEEKQASQPQRLPKPSKVKKMTVASSSSDVIAPLPANIEQKVPSLEVAPVGIDPAKAAESTTTKERKSRLATPRKVRLPQATPTVFVDGKENQQSRILVATTPKKGLPIPQVIIPPTIESGLPRRRGLRR